ncbi:MAG: lipopolysaccharide biosynthesis protein [Pseudomonadota bacterium]
MAPAESPGRMQPKASGAVGGLLGRSAVFFFASGVSRGLPFLLLPFLTRYLSPADFGRLSMATAVASVLAILIGLNPHLFVTVKYAKAPRDELARYVCQALVLCGWSFAAVCLFVLFVPHALGRYGIAVPVAFVLAGVGLSRAVEMMSLTILQMEKRAIAFLGYSILAATTTATLTIGLVGFSPIGWAGSVVAECVGVGMTAALVTRSVARRGYVCGGFDRSRTIEMVRFSLPLVPHTLAFWALSAAGRFFIAEHFSDTEVGMFGVAHSLGLGLSLVHESCQRAWQPDFMKALADGGRNRLRMVVAATWGYYLAAVIIGWAYAEATAHLLPIIVGPAYEDAVPLVLPICLAHTFLGMYRLVAGYLYFNSRTGTLALITVLSAALCVVLNMVLVPREGAQGAAIAMAVAFGACFLAVKLASMMAHRMPWFSFWKP